MPDLNTSLNTAIVFNSIATPQSITGNVSATDSLDYYRVRLTGRSSVNFSLTGLSGDANLALIRDGNNNGTVDAGEVLASSRNAGTMAELVNLATLEAGVYYVEVSLGTGPTPAAYTLGGQAQMTQLSAPVAVDRLYTASQLNWRNETTGEISFWRMNNDYLRDIVSGASNPDLQYQGLGVGSLNGDKQVALFWRDLNTGDFRRWTMARVTGVIAEDQVMVANVPLAVEVQGLADFNGDGLTDILWRNSVTQQVGFWLTGTTGVIEIGLPLTQPSADWKIEQVGDLNGDGKADIVWRNYTTQEMGFWLMNGSQLLNGAGIALDNSAGGAKNWELTGLGDLNGDRKLDLIWRNTTTQQVGYWLMDGVTATAYNATNGISADWQIVALADLNGDKKTDIVFQNQVTQQAAFWVMNGTSFVQTGVKALPTGYQLLKLADNNLDSKVDLGWWNPSTREVRFWLMDGVTVTLDTPIGSPIQSPTAMSPLGRKFYGIPTPIDEAGSTSTTALTVGALNAIGSYRGMVSSTDNSDVYQFTVSTSSIFNFSLTGLTGNADLNLRNGSNTLLQSSANAGTTAESFQRTLTPGTYWVEVVSSNGNTPVNYTLTLQNTTPPDLQAPVIAAKLSNDTGPLNMDGVTVDPTIQGTITDSSSIAAFRAGFGTTPTSQYVNILGALGTNGQFTLDPTRLAQINGGNPLIAGTYTLPLQAQDAAGNWSTVLDVAFKLNPGTQINNLTSSTPVVITDPTRPTNDTQASVTPNTLSNFPPGGTVSVTGRSDGGLTIDMGNALCSGPIAIQTTLGAAGATPRNFEIYRLGGSDGPVLVGSGTSANGIANGTIRGSGSGGNITSFAGSGSYLLVPTDFIPIGLADIDRNPDEACESCKARKQFNADASVELHAGTVTKNHDLITYQGMDETRGVRLTYNSLTADPRPIVHFGYNGVPGGDQYRLVAKLTVKESATVNYEVKGYQGNTVAGANPNEHFWNIPTGGGTVGGALQLDKDLESGIYEYTLESGIKTMCNCQTLVGRTQTQKDELVVVNRINSAFGSGWGIAGWQEITESATRVLILDGDGSHVVFNKGDSFYVAAAGDFSTLEKTASGTFKRTLKDGTVYTFNAQNKLATVTDRNARTTTYQYNTAGQLEKIIDPRPAGILDATGFTTTLVYNPQGKVTAISSPGNRITTLIYDTNGDLRQVIDPDQTSRIFTYEDHHLTTEQDKLQSVNKITYDFAGRAKSAVDKDGQIRTVNPAQVQGLADPQGTAKTIDPLKAPVAYQAQPTIRTGQNIFLAAEAKYTDNADTTYVKLDRAQQTLIVKDSQGVVAESVSGKGSTSNPTGYLPTQSTDGRGNTSFFSYDGKGNLIATQDALSSGTLATQTLFSSPIDELPHSIARSHTADVNADGWLDFVSNGRVSYSDGRGNFSAPVDLTGNQEVLPGQDFTGDGRLDLVYATTPLWQNGSQIGEKLEIFARAQTLPSAFNSVFTVNVQGSTNPIRRFYAVNFADVDRNGTLDLYAIHGVDAFPVGGDYSSPGDCQLEIWLNTGSNLNPIWNANSNRFTVNLGDLSQLSTTQLSLIDTLRLKDIVVGDINGDQKLDFAVVPFGSSQLRFVLSQTTPNTTTLSGYTIGTFDDNSNTQRLAWGNVMGDGRTEMIVGNTDGSVVIKTLSVSSQNVITAVNAAAFPSLALFSQGLDAVYLQDVNGDQWLDLVAAGRDGDQRNLAVLLHEPAQSTGIFGPVQKYAVAPGANLADLQFGNFTHSITDANWAGKPDIVLGSYERVSPMLMNQGAGRFSQRATAVGTELAIGGQPTMMAMGDFNGDGSPDLITANGWAVAAGEPKVYLTLSNGDGTFGRSRDFTISPTATTKAIAMAVGDVNGDRALDVVTANSDGTLAIGLGDGNGGFTFRTWQTNLTRLTELKIADLQEDANGDLDLILANGAAVAVWFGQGTAAWTGSNIGFSALANATYAYDGPYNGPITALALGDVSGDGRADLVAIANNQVTVRLGGSNGTLATTVTALPVNGFPTALALGDFNRDLRQDIVALTRNGNSDTRVSLFLSQSSTTFDGSSFQRLDYPDLYGTDTIRVQDVNQDTYLDVVGSNGDRAWVMLGQANGTLAGDRRRGFALSYPTYGFELADLDGDSDLDLVGLSQDASGRGRGSVRLNDTVQLATGLGTGKQVSLYDQRFDFAQRQLVTFNNPFNQVMVTIDELGRQTLYDRDSRGNALRMVRVVDGVDSELQISNRSGNDVVTSYTYTAEGRIATVTDAAGRVTKYDYTVDAVLNRAGNLRSVTTAFGTLEAATQWFEYDAVGNQAAVVDENSNRTRYEYDPTTNRLLKVIAADPDGDGDLKSPITQYQYDANGNQTKVIDPLLRETVNRYDAMGRLIESVGADPDGAGPLKSPITRYRYDATGNLQYRIDPLDYERALAAGVDPVVNPAGYATEYQYDARGQLVRTIGVDGKVQAQQRYDADGNAIGNIDGNTNRSTSIYDARGRRIREVDAAGNATRFVYDAANQLIAQVDAKNGVTRFRYDQLGRRIEVMDALGNRTQTTYDKMGNVLTETTAVGTVDEQKMEYRYDLRDRRVRVYDANNPSSLGTAKFTETAYDKVDNVLAITDPTGNRTRYQYDGLNRLTTETIQSLTEANQVVDLSRLLEYDAVGNRTKMTDRNGQVRTFIYDGLNRQTHEQWWAGSSLMRTIQSNYNVGDQLTSITDPAATYTYTYDGLGRLRTVSNAGTSGAPTVLFTYNYDDAGNLKAVVDSLGGTVAYDFNALNQVMQISQTGTNIQTKTVALTYNPLGQVTTLTRSAGGQLVAQTNYAYDPLNRLAGLQHQRGTTTLSAYSYTYDAASRIKTLTDGTGTTTYTYDKTNQLTGADRPNTLPDEAYSYDANGNRTNAGYATRQDNRLRSDGTYTYRYDNEGNLTSQIGAGVTREFTWDYRNRLTRVVDKNASGIAIKSVDYTYDALNQRIAKAVDPDGAGAQAPTVTRFVYDRDHVALEFTGSTTTRYLYGTEVDQILAMEKASQTTWLLTDHLGSVRQGVNNAGTITGSLEYNSFGQVVSQTGAVSDWRYRYTGREFDGETGLYYYRARYYDAGVGRFIGQDPIGFAAGDANLYRYVGNNSVSNIDPSGKFKVELRYRKPIGAHVDIVVSDKTGMRAYWATAENQDTVNQVVGILGTPETGTILEPLVGSATTNVLRAYAKAAQLAGVGFGRIDAKNINPYNSSFLFYVGNPDSIQQVYSDNSDCPNETLEKKILNTLVSIKNKKIAYDPLRTNSNSAAFSTLRAIGLGKNLRPIKNLPGWDNDLLGNGPTPTPMPGPQPRTGRKRG